MSEGREGLRLEMLPMPTPAKPPAAPSPLWPARPGCFSSDILSSICLGSKEKLEASAKRRFRLRLRAKVVTAMITMIKAASPASPKTNPARGLFSRKDFPLGSEVPLEGGAVSEVVSVIVVAPGVRSGGVGVETEDTVDGLLESQHSGTRGGWF